MGWLEVTTIKNVSDVIVIGFSLLVTVVFVYVGVNANNYFIHKSNNSASKIVDIVGTSEYSTILPLNGKMIPGDQAIQIVDTYRTQCPILLVTGELYKSAGRKFSYDVSRIHDRSANEYLNPGFNFELRVYKSGGEVVCIGVVQESVAKSSNIATYATTAAECQASQEMLTKTNNLIQQQLHLYQMLQ